MEFEARADAADMATETPAARLLVHRAAALRGPGAPFANEASMAKLYPVERYDRDAKRCEIGEGTSEVQRIVISREILR